MGIQECDFIVTRIRPEVFARAFRIVTFVREYAPLSGKLREGCELSPWSNISTNTRAVLVQVNLACFIPRERFLGYLPV